MPDILKNKYFKFAIVAIIYILWVIWVGNYWLLFGLAVIFDIYITKKVNWSFWKKREGPNNTFIEWLDALIFAVIAVTLINIFLFQNYRIPTPSMEKSLRVGDHLFVSKVAYGPRLPNTPIAFPFTQHTIPIIKTRSWSNLVTAPFKRLKGFGDVERFDAVVFNFPAGDTVVLQNQVTAYEEILRSEQQRLKNYDQYTSGNTRTDKEYERMAREEVWKNNDIIYRPVDRRENYVKRCVGIPGDTLEIRGGVLFVNGKEIEPIDTQQTNYWVQTDGTRINPKAFERLDIYKSNQNMVSGTMYLLPLTESNAEKLRTFRNVKEVKKQLRRPGEYGAHIFPHNPYYPWNEDYFGPLWIPAKGATVKLDSNNISIYRRIIDVYEDNDLEVDGNSFKINGEETDSYTFKMDYYWMMGDNRHNSADSRFWGYVPEDHIVGEPKFIWLSVDKEASGLKKIRLRRMFHGVK
ncbi:MAG TPA: S26 family signal peptidase [Bacteroidales bacterium]|nr:S26 family signal peptidase [Bacteroidales bacterium]